MKLLVATQAVDVNDPILGFFHGWLIEFAKRFERIDVICLRKGVYNLPSHVHVHSLGKEEGENRIKYSIRFYRYFADVFLRVKVDYVFFHMGAIYNILAFPFFVLRRLFGTTFIWWKTHGKVGSIMDTMALACTDKVVTAGGKSFSIVSAKVRVVGHAIDLNLFTDRKNDHRRDKRLLMVGRIVPIKKIEVALRACERLKDIPDLELILVGGADKQEYQEQLKGLIVEKGIGTVVSFLGPRTHTEVTKEYERSYILIHPAYEAGFDKVVLEAMATGVIPLTSIPSFKPILAPLGLFVEAEDDAGYAIAIRRIMSMGEDEHSLLRRSLRVIVEKDHSLSTISARIFDI